MSLNSTLRDVCSLFGVAFHRMRRDIDLPGSPERCLARTAIEDERGEVFVLERLPIIGRRRREGVARTLFELHRGGMEQVAAPLRSRSGEFATQAMEYCWRLTPFVRGVPLPQPDYVFEEARGHALAAFMLRLDHPDTPAPADPPDLPWRLDAFADDLRAKLAVREPSVLSRIRPALDALTPFLAEYASLPTTLRHGDLHPGNVIWDEAGGIRAVIDWEFCGARPRLYDLAVCLGCLGFEDPRALARGASSAMLGDLLAAGYLVEDEGPLLFNLTLALRLGWLAEWLRGGERGLLQQELDYLDLLLRLRPRLEAHWARGGKGG
ncbi:phosphotransferase [Desulfohalovibrio reitneri]|uniref:phosphotransferase n=1 Tax=Desulfohalovibrio reitneri TaxID=1307759 RepID=UPI00068F467A|nr:phosphotransferase [Desulfohalovibrio reitneri]